MAACWPEKYRNPHVIIGQIIFRVKEKHILECGHIFLSTNWQYSINTAIR
jgi:hypothetical protein